MGTKVQEGVKVLCWHSHSPPCLLACFARGRDDDEEEEVGVEEDVEDVEEDDHHEEYMDSNNNYDAGSRTHPHLCLALGEGKIMKITIMMMHLPSRESLPTPPTHPCPVAPKLTTRSESVSGCYEAQQIRC